MNSFNKGVLFAGSLGLVLTGSVMGQNLFVNQGFESGTYPTSGSGTTPYSFAGQDAHGAGGTGTGTSTTSWSITGWTFTSGNNGQIERWINDSDDTVRAQGGNRYLYLSTTTTSGAGNGCLQYTSGGGLNFAAGTTYSFSFWAADAGSTASTQPKIGFEVQGGGTGPNVLQTVSLPLNAAWSDSNESAIPWVQYSFSWTPTANYSNPNFYWSVFSGGAGSTGSVVLDNVSVSVAAVPEAHTVAAGIFMAGLVGGAIYRRRKAQA